MKLICDVKDFIPEKIIPRTGELKKPRVLELFDKFILAAPYCSKVVSLPKKIILTEKDIMAIGLYLAEGQRFVNFNNKSSYHTGEISFANSELVSLKLFCSFLNKFGVAVKDLRWLIFLNLNYKDIDNKKLVDYWIKTLNLDPNNSRPRWLFYTGSIKGRLTDLTSKYGCLQLGYSSVIFRSFFLNFINKFFENAINDKDKKILSLILKGYFAGDGHVAFKLKPRRKNISFGVKDKKLLSMLKESLRIIGLKSIKETFPERTKINSKSIVIYNLHDFKVLDSYNIISLISYKSNKFNALLKSYMSPGGFEPPITSL